MLKRHFLKQLVREIFIMLYCLIFILGLITNIIFTGGSIFYIVMISFFLLVGIMLIFIIRSERNVYKNFCKEFGNPDIKMKQLKKFSRTVQPICNTWIDDEFIVYPNKELIIDATKVIWAFTEQQKNGEKIEGYNLCLALNDGQINRIKYDNMFSAKRVLQRVNEEMPYIFIGYDEQIDQLYNINIYRLVNEVEIAKASGRNDGVVIEFNDENLYGNNITSFEQYKERAKPSIIALLIVGILPVFFCVKCWPLVVSAGNNIIHTYAKLTICTEKTTAQVIDANYFNEYHSSGRKRHSVTMSTPIFEYETNNGDIIEVKSNTNYVVNDHKAEIGDEVILYYNPNNPEDYLCENDIPEKIGDDIMSMVVFGIIVYLAIWMICIDIEATIDSKNQYKELNSLDKQTISMYP